MVIPVLWRDRLRLICLVLMIVVFHAATTAASFRGNDLLTSTLTAGIVISLLVALKFVMPIRKDVWFRSATLGVLTVYVIVMGYLTWITMSSSD